MTYRLFSTIIFCTYCIAAYTQDSTGKVPAKYFETVSKKSSQLEQKFDKKSEKILVRLQKQEERIRKKLSRIDSLAANNIFSDAETKYRQLEEKLKNNQILTQYLPFLDTVSTSLKFLQQNSEWLGEVKEAKEKISEAFTKVKELESQLQKAEDIKQFLKERRQYLKEQLSKFGFAKELKKLNKEVFSYAEQIKEYKEILKDPKKIERKAIDLLTKSKLFQDFMKKNSLLASLFRMPGDPNDPAYAASLAGLQTRTQVNALIQNQIAIGGPNAQQQISQNIQSAQSQLQQLKDKVTKWGGGSSDDILPEGFRPNNQKTKSFLQRLELSCSFGVFEMIFNKRKLSVRGLPAGALCGGATPHL